MENEESQIRPSDHMKTLVSCLGDLADRGFNAQFKAVPSGLMSLDTKRIFNPEQIKVVHYYRFEGESNPSDSSILYALEVSSGEKGTLVDGYGPSSDPLAGKIMQQVEEIHK